MILVPAERTIAGFIVDYGAVALEDGGQGKLHGFHQVQGYSGHGEVEVPPTPPYNLPAGVLARCLVTTDQMTGEPVEVRYALGPGSGMIAAWGAEPSRSATFYSPQFTTTGLQLPLFSPDAHALGIVLVSGVDLDPWINLEPLKRRAMLRALVEDQDGAPIISMLDRIAPSPKGCVSAAVFRRGGLVIPVDV